MQPVSRFLPWTQSHPKDVFILVGCCSAHPLQTQHQHDPQFWFITLSLFRIQAHFSVWGFKLYLGMAAVAPRLVLTGAGLLCRLLDLCGPRDVLAFRDKPLSHNIQRQEQWWWRDADSSGYQQGAEEHWSQHETPTQNQQKNMSPKLKTSTGCTRWPENSREK